MLNSFKIKVTDSTAIFTETTRDAPSVTTTYWRIWSFVSRKES